MNESIVGSGGQIATDSGTVGGKGLFSSLMNLVIKKGSIGTTSSVQVFEADIIGKTLAKYQRGYMLNLPGTGPWDIKITRTTDDSTTANISNELWWSDYVEIINAKLNYPNSAMVYTAIDAEQFSSIPSRSFEIYGIKCKIPSNYNQATRTYTGFWDGTFVTAWTDNPAWVFYDIVTSTRYGLGDVVSAELVDKWTLYSIAQYCDGLVPDGKGSFEPRFTCNLYLQTREDAYKVVANLASIFRGMVFWATGLVTASQDAPKAIDAIYTAANVIDGAFSYTGTSAKTRHNVVLVSWNNPENGYALEIEYIEDAASIIKNGIIQTEISAMGCTSQGQAHRLGKWLLYTEQNETETVSFKTGLDGLLCQPGDVIQTQDPFRSGKRLGGRVVSISIVPGVSADITVDSPILFEVGKVYTVLLTSTTGTIISHTLSNTLNNTEQSTLSITTTETINIQIGSVWVVAVSDLSLQSWRVISVSESSKGSVDVSALMYNADKYAAIEYNLSLRPRAITTISTTPPTVSNISILEHMYLAGTNRLSNKLSISWVEPSNSIDTYIINYTKTSDNSNPKYITVNIPNVEIEDVSEGEYTIGIISVNALGVKSANVSTTYTVVGKTVSPADISNFRTVLLGDSINLKWDPLPDLDIEYYEVRYGSWGLNTDTTYVYRGTNSEVTLPATYISGASHLFYIKAKDTSGNWSESYKLNGTLINNITAKILLNTVPAATILPILVTNSATSITNTIALPNPPTVAVLSLKNNILKISWTAPSTGANNISTFGYRIYVTSSIGGINTTIVAAEVTTTSYEYLWLDSTLSKTFRIETIDSTKQASLPDLEITKTFTIPNIVTGLTSSFSSNKLTLAWNAPIPDSSDADTKLYRIYLNSIAITEVTGTRFDYTWSDTGLSKTFAIETVDTINNISPKVTSVIPVLVPAAPTNLLTSLSGVTLKASWTHSILVSNSFPIAKYNIYFGDIGNPIKIGETVSNSYELDWSYGVGTKAIFIEAVDIVGNISSTRTNVSITIVAPNAPTNLIATMKATKILFAWNPAPVAINSLPIEYYELREGGTAWLDSTFVANIPASTNILQYLYGIINTTELSSTPIGTLKYNQAKVFRISSKDGFGTYSSAHTSFSITLTKPSIISSLALNIVGPYINATWSPIIPGSSLDIFTLPIDRYEIRATRSLLVDEGTWASATTLASLSGSAIALDPPLNPSSDPTNNADGTWYYLIRAYDSFNIAGALASKQLTLTKPSAPISFTNKVIDNNILLNWVDPEVHSFPINTFMLKKSLDPLVSYTGAQTIGTKSGGFTTVFEESSGNYSYFLTAIDTAGNIGTSVRTNAVVSQPPDYVLTGDIYRDDFAVVTYGTNTLVSTKTNVVMSDALGVNNTDKILGPVSSIQNFQTHFTGNAWTGPSAQVAAGYPVYAQPSLTNGTLSEVIDYGITFTTNQYVSLSTDISNLVGTTGTYKVTLSTSADGITYTSASSAVQSATTANTTFGTFALGFRYVKVEILLTAGTPGIDLIRINSYRLKLSLKYTNDGGSASVDTTGIYQLNLLGGGSGYTTTPTVTIGGSGREASAYANIGGITIIPLSSGGTGYTIPPTVVITNGGYTTIARATAIISSGVLSIQITDTGSYYTSNPTVTLVGGAYTTAATLGTTLANNIGVVTQVLVTDSGTGYTTIVPGDISIVGGGGSGCTISSITKTSAVSGTIVSFNYTYLDVSNIQITYGGTTPGIAIYDFVDITYPKFFRVLLFSNTGTPITGNFSWSAKGTI